VSLHAIHRAEIERYRHSMNLVGPGPVEFHFVDCRRALTGLELRGLWADLGSGAGFPGLVMAELFPELRVELVESRRKRTTFLEHVLLAASAEEASSRVRIRHCRVEDLEPHWYEGVVSRAFAPPQRVLEHADRLLRADGAVLLLLKEGMVGSLELPDHYQREKVVRYEVGGRQRCSVLLRRR